MSEVMPGRLYMGTLHYLEEIQGGTVGDLVRPILVLVTVIRSHWTAHAGVIKPAHNMETVVLMLIKNVEVDQHLVLVLASVVLKQATAIASVILIVKHMEIAVMTSSRRAPLPVRVMWSHIS